MRSFALFRYLLKEAAPLLVGNTATACCAVLLWPPAWTTPAWSLIIIGILVWGVIMPAFVVSNAREALRLIRGIVPLTSDDGEPLGIALWGYHSPKFFLSLMRATDYADNLDSHTPDDVQHGWLEGKSITFTWVGEGDLADWTKLTTPPSLDDLRF